jgi:hypothetical protein
MVTLNQTESTETPRFESARAILRESMSDSDLYRDRLRVNSRLASGRPIESGQFTDEEFFNQIRMVFVIVES